MFVRQGGGDHESDETRAQSAGSTGRLSHKNWVGPSTPKKSNVKRSASISSSAVRPTVCTLGVGLHHDTCAVAWILLAVMTPAASARTSTDISSAMPVMWLLGTLAKVVLHDAPHKVMHM